MFCNWNAQHFWNDKLFFRRTFDLCALSLSLCSHIFRFKRNIYLYFLFFFFFFWLAFIKYICCVGCFEWIGFIPCYQDEKQICFIIIFFSAAIWLPNWRQFVFRLVYASDKECKTKRSQAKPNRAMKKEREEKNWESAKESLNTDPANCILYIQVAFIFVIQIIREQCNTKTTIPR